MNPSISIVTPSIRKGGLDMLAECLKRQTFQEFEWIIVTPLDIRELIRPHEFHREGSGEWVAYWLDANKAIYVPEPPKREGDFYGLNKAWNAAFKRARGELILSIVDQTWIAEDTLEMFWSHYQANPNRLVGGVGDQYERVTAGKPEVIVWKDPRKRQDLGSFYEISPIDLEWCVTSIPKQALIDIGGMDEEWDKYAALSEKEACFRMDEVGYAFWLDQSIEYRALSHHRIGGKEKWDEAYKKGCAYLDKIYPLIKSKARIKLKYLDNHSK